MSRPPLTAPSSLPSLAHSESAGRLVPAAGGADGAWVALSDLAREAGLRLLLIAGIGLTGLAVILAWLAHCTGEAVRGLKAGRPVA